MGKYFGTDGIRGLANSPELDGTLAFHVGLALSYVLGSELVRKPKVLIGRDTRLSGYMLENAIAAGLCAGGCDVILGGLLPTPAVAMMCAKSDDIDGGIVISASHNPFYDNGIKIFGHDGRKLLDDRQAAVERIIDELPGDIYVAPESMGTVKHSRDIASKYCDFVVSSAPRSLEGLRILVDCANGATSETAKAIFPALSAQADFIYHSPDGININDKCGSTHMDDLCRRTVQGGYDVGIAFDGDGDRCLMCDEQGNLIDGDAILTVLTADMLRLGTLRGGVVGTVLTNMGISAYINTLGAQFISADVGDRYVLEQMLLNRCNLGGEQSGHIILLDHCTTGDGQLTAVHMLCAMLERECRASELCTEVVLYPQIALNVSVPNNLKDKIAQSPAVLEVLDTIRQAFGSDGRIIIRPSGTEPKVRVMAEGKDKALVEALASQAAQVISDEVGKYIEAGL